MINGKYLLPMLYATAMSCGFYEPKRKGSTFKEVSEPRKPVIPKGCKEFVYEGEFGEIRVTAINKKNANKKFQKILNDIYEHTN